MQKSEYYYSPSRNDRPLVDHVPSKSIERDVLHIFLQYRIESGPIVNIFSVLLIDGLKGFLSFVRPIMATQSHINSGSAFIEISSMLYPRFLIF
jgi:hypothetical protein